jgi:signal transduction histidine kinase
MKRLKILLFIFCLALSIPLTYFVLLTYRSLEQEEIAQLRFFGDTLFDEIEKTLAELILQEENRPVSEYFYLPTVRPSDKRDLVPSPLSQLPQTDYILGYFQNNPDGSFQTPLIPSSPTATPHLADVVNQLENANQAFNLKRTSDPEHFEKAPPIRQEKAQQPKEVSLADNYLKLNRKGKTQERLGQKNKRVEQISPSQALSFERQDQVGRIAAPKPMAVSGENRPNLLAKKDEMQQKPFAYRQDEGLKQSIQEREANEAKTAASDLLDRDNDRLTVEIDPMQSVFIDEYRIFIFRRMMIGNRIYRQGFIVLANEFLNHLANVYFMAQPMARFTHLSLHVKGRGSKAVFVEAGALAEHPKFFLARTFPRPFSFLRGTLTCEHIPRSAGRRTLTIMLTVLAAIVLLGLFAIYHSVHTIVDLSERRSRFVSSVTHELKTPLTNIRMYIEMLEQGIATTPEREQEYFSILDSESARLARLINNVLEFSKLEKKALRLDLRSGIFTDVIDAVKNVMGEKLRQEGFRLHVVCEKMKPFRYDREVMIQVLINLMENSMKFSRTSPEKEITLRVRREKERVIISVADKGPGIPRHALKKIFDDFYRVDSTMINPTRGTGIGLAFVRKFIAAAGGTVAAANNDGFGCTITIALPFE